MFVKSILSLICFSLPFFIYSPEELSINSTTAPEVTIVEPKQNMKFQWGDQVRYRIVVSDKYDGDSEFGEINPMEVILETQFVSEMNDVERHKNFSSQNLPEYEGLSLLSKSTCFSCHADKSKLVGPSFSDISKRYSQDSESLNILSNSIVNGSSGKWSDFQMPPNSNLSIEEAKKIITYILQQGSNEYNRVYTGLEGVFRIMEKPEGTERGFYVLTASYTNNAQEMSRGQDAVVLEVK